jgi:hypothetical protein
MSTRTAALCALGTVLALGLASCKVKFNASFEMSGMETDTPVPAPVTKTPLTALPTPTETPAPTLTPAPTAAPVQGPGMVSADDEDAICRFGPGEEWSIDGKLPVGTSVPIAGRNKDSSWWYVKGLGYKERPCWVSAEETRSEGDLDDIPIQPTPAAIVSVVKVSVEPWKATIACDDFPYAFKVKFTISTSGPVTVTFQRSRNGDKDSAETIVFKTFGTKTYNDEYQVDEVGEYRYRVEVSSPNKISAEDKGKMECDS